MQTEKTTINPITNHAQAVKSTHSPLSWRGVGGEASEASIRSMTRKELAQLAGVSGARCADGYILTTTN